MVRGSVLLVADAPAHHAPRTTHRQCRVIPTYDTGRQIVFPLCRRESAIRCSPALLVGKHVYSSTAVEVPTAVNEPAAWWSSGRLNKNSRPRHTIGSSRAQHSRGISISAIHTIEVELLPKLASRKSANIDEGDVRGGWRENVHRHPDRIEGHVRAPSSPCLRHPHRVWKP
ncbi:unnamed protein product [Ectocarpus sp. 12 AP-2014]